MSFLYQNYIALYLPLKQQFKNKTGQPQLPRLITDFLMTLQITASSTCQTQ